MKKLFKVYLKQNKIVLGEKIVLANSFFDRAIGLMFRKDLKEFDGMLLDPAKSIHTFFMHFPLDLIFLDKNNKVVKIYSSLRPWRVTRVVLKARKVLEIKGGMVPPNSDLIGDEVQIECSN